MAPTTAARHPGGAEDVAAASDEAAGFRFGSSGLAPQLVQMLPYLAVALGLTLVALRRGWVLRRRARRVTGRHATAVGAP